MRISPGEAQQIDSIMAAAGIPTHVWLPIMHLESGGNPLAHNPRGEDSRGLFQINMAVQGIRNRLARYNLFDPIVNAMAILQRDWLGNPGRLRRMQGMASPADQAEMMWRDGIRPRWTNVHSQRIRHYATAGLPGLMEIYGLQGREQGQVIAPARERPEILTLEEEIAFAAGEGEDGAGEERPPSWLNPFERLWWEARRITGRVLIVVLGSVVVLGAAWMLLGVDIPAPKIYQKPKEETGKGEETA